MIRSRVHFFTQRFFSNQQRKLDDILDKSYDTVERRKELFNPSGSIFKISSVFSPLECQKLIEFSEQIQFQEEKFITDLGEGIKTPEQNRINVNKEILNFSHLIIHDETNKFTNQIYNRIKQYLPETFDDVKEKKQWKVKKLHETHTICKYALNQQFKPQTPGISNKLADGTGKKYSVIIYVNDDYKGGETEFNKYVVDPELGSAVVFYNKFIHVSAPLQSGTKYLFLTDAIYEPIKEI